MARPPCCRLDSFRARCENTQEQVTTAMSPTAKVRCRVTNKPKAWGAEPLRQSLRRPSSKRQAQGMSQLPGAALTAIGKATGLWDGDSDSDSDEEVAFDPNEQFVKRNVNASRCCRVMSLCFLLSLVFISDGLSSFEVSTLSHMTISEDLDVAMAISGCDIVMKQDAFPGSPDKVVIEILTPYGGIVKTPQRDKQQLYNKFFITNKKPCKDGGQCSSSCKVTLHFPLQGNNFMSGHRKMEILSNPGSTADGKAAPVAIVSTAGLDLATLSMNVHAVMASVTLSSLTVKHLSVTVDTAGAIMASNLTMESASLVSGDDNVIVDTLIPTYVSYKQDSNNFCLQADHLSHVTNAINGSAICSAAQLTAAFELADSDGTTTVSVEEFNDYCAITMDANGCKMAERYLFNFNPSEPPKQALFEAEYTSRLLELDDLRLLPQCSRNSMLWETVEDPVTKACFDTYTSALAATGTVSGPQLGNCVGKLSWLNLKSMSGNLHVQLHSHRGTSFQLNEELAMTPKSALGMKELLDAYGTAESPEDVFVNFDFTASVQVPPGLWMWATREFYFEVEPAWLFIFSPPLQPPLKRQSLALAPGFCSRDEPSAARQVRLWNLISAHLKPDLLQNPEAVLKGAVAYKSHKPLKPVVQVADNKTESYTDQFQTITWELNPLFGEIQLKVLDWQTKTMVLLTIGLSCTLAVILSFIVTSGVIGGITLLVRDKITVVRDWKVMVHKEKVNTRKLVELAGRRQHEAHLRQALAMNDDAEAKALLNNRPNAAGAVKPQVRFVVAGGTFAFPSPFVMITEIIIIPLRARLIDSLARFLWNNCITGVELEKKVRENLIFPPPEFRKEQVVGSTEVVHTVPQEDDATPVKLLYRGETITVQWVPAFQSDSPASEPLTFVEVEVDENNMALVGGKVILSDGSKFENPVDGMPNDIAEEGIRMESSEDAMQEMWLDREVERSIFNCSVEMKELKARYGRYCLVERLLEKSTAEGLPKLKKIFNLNLSSRRVNQIKGLRWKSEVERKMNFSPDNGCIVNFSLALEGHLPPPRKGTNIAWNQKFQIANGAKLNEKHILVQPPSADGEYQPALVMDIIARTKSNTSASGGSPTRAIVSTNNKVMPDSSPKAGEIILTPREGGQPAENAPDDAPAKGSKPKLDEDVLASSSPTKTRVNDLNAPDVVLKNKGAARGPQLDTNFESNDKDSEAKEAPQSKSQWGKVKMTVPTLQLMKRQKSLKYEHIGRDDEPTIRIKDSLPGSQIMYSSNKPSMPNDAAYGMFGLKRCNDRTDVKDGLRLFLAAHCVRTFSSTDTMEYEVFQEELEKFNESHKSKGTSNFQAEDSTSKEDFEKLGLTFETFNKESVFGLQFRHKIAGHTAGSKGRYRPPLSFFCVEFCTVVAHIVVIIFLPWVGLFVPMVIQNKYIETTAVFPADMWTLGSALEARSATTFAQFEAEFFMKNMLPGHWIMLGVTFSFYGFMLIKLFLHYLDFGGSAHDMTVRKSISGCSCSCTTFLFRMILRWASYILIIAELFLMITYISYMCMWMLLAAVVNPTVYLPYSVCIATLTVSVGVVTSKLNDAAAKIKKALDNNVKKLFEAKLLEAAVLAAASKKAMSSEGSKDKKSIVAEMSATDVFQDFVKSKTSPGGDIPKCINFEEFCELLARLDLSLSDAKKLQVFVEADNSGEGWIGCDEFELAWVSVQNDLTTQALESMGLSDARIKMVVAFVTMFLCLLFAFIFVGMAALVNGPTSFGSVINSFMVSAGGTSASSGDTSGGDDDAEEAGDEALAVFTG